LPIFAKAGNKNFLIIQNRISDGATFHTSWVNVSTGAIGTKAAAHAIKTWPLANGWYRVEVRESSSGAGANANLFAFGFTDADNSHTLTGDGATVNGTVWGAQYEIDGFVPTSYIPTVAAPVARVADTATKAHGSTPQPRALYAKFTATNAAASTTHDIVSLGGIAGPNDQFFRFAAVNTVKGDLHNNAVFVAAAPTGAPAWGDTVEFRAASNTDTSITGGQSLNGGAETTNTTAASAAYQGAYTGANYILGNAMTGPLAIQQWKDILGSAITMAQCQAA
jgi:hypothetical protein